MSFQITLLANKSDNRIVSKNLTVMGSIIDMNFRDDFDVINPTFIIQTGTTNILTVNAQIYPEADFKRDLFKGVINYISTTVNTFVRYYYIMNVNYIQDNIIEINCHEDVLMTYRTQIIASNGIIRRNENAYNLYIKDEKIGVYEKPIVRQLKFPTGFSSTTPSYILTTSGADPTASSYVRTSQFNIQSEISSYAHNGGEIVWLPNAMCDLYPVYNLPSIDEFRAKINSTSQWVICNKAALYYDPEPQSPSDYYDSNMWCIAVTNYDQATDTLTLMQVTEDTFDGILYVTQKNASSFKGYVWSVGGQIDTVTGRFGTDLMVNNTLINAGATTHRNFRTPAEFTLNRDSANTIKFYCNY